MADTTIRGWVTTWSDDGPPPRPQLPVRCLEDELLPDVAPLAPHVAPTLRGAKTAEKIRATVAARGRPAGRTCRGCELRREVEGCGFCSAPACQALRRRIEAAAEAPRVTGRRQRR